MPTSIIKLFFLLLITFNVVSSTYYMSPNGNDNNLGSSSSPFLTFQKSMNVIQPGDTLYLKSGSYPERINTLKDGKPDLRITITGDRDASVNSIHLSRPYYTIHGINVTNVVGAVSNSRKIYMMRNAHYTILSNLFIDVGMVDSRTGIEWQAPSTKPFGTNAASNYKIVNNRMTRLWASTAMAIYGDNGLIESNIFHDIGSCDFIRLWGRTNIIRNNIFTNNYVIPNSGNHVDFIQTFGNLGFGSIGHIIENNIITKVEGQFSQLSATASPYIYGWTFRNNIISYITLQGSCTIPNVSYYNNIFYRCNTVNGGSALNFGSRWFERSSVNALTPGYELISSPIKSGNIIEGANYVVRSSDGGFITYNGIQYDTGRSFFGVSSVSNFISSTTGTLLWRRLPDFAHGTRIMNNLFYECGDGGANSGYYALSDGVTNVLADYNFSSRTGNLPFRADAQQRPVGHPDGWDSFRWYEPNGFNGGDPMLLDPENGKFNPKEGSPLIDAGILIPSVIKDFVGTSRPVGNKYDIGPYEFNGFVPPLDPEDPPPIPDPDPENGNDIELLPPVIWITMQNDYQSDGFLRDYSGNDAHAMRFGWRGQEPWTDSTNFPVRVNGRVNRYASEWTPYFFSEGFNDTLYWPGRYAAITNIPESIISPTKMTIAVWAKHYNVPDDTRITTSKLNNNCLISTGWSDAGCWYLGRFADTRNGMMQFMVITNGISLGNSIKVSFPETNTFVDHEWTHYGVTSEISPLGDNLSVQLYLNGNQVVNTNYPIADGFEFSTFNINDPPGGGMDKWIRLSCWGHSTSPILKPEGRPNTGWFYGLMDDLRIYNRVLTPDEILYIFNSENQISNAILTPPTNLKLLN